MNKRQKKKYSEKSNISGIKGKRSSAGIKYKSHRNKPSKAWRPPAPKPDNLGDIDFRIKNNINNIHRKDDIIS